MKICFWSHVRKNTGVTTNMACVAALTSLDRKGKSILLENHYSTNSLGDNLLSEEQTNQLKESGAFYNRYGIEYVLKRLASGEDGDKLVHQAAIPLLFSTLFYLPQGRIVNKEIFDYEFSMVQNELFLSLEGMCEYVFVDTETNQNSSSVKLLSEADLVVVNLEQEYASLKQFFDNYTSLNHVVYLIGNYRPEHTWNVAHICKEFKIPKDKIGVIPYNMDLKIALMQGKLLQFLNRNYYSSTDKEIEYFIRYAKRSSRMIRKNALELQRKMRKCIS